MEWLEAAAAFSVVMMVFSTLATAALETLHRVFRLREKGLTNLIDQIYSKVITLQTKRQATDVRASNFRQETTNLHVERGAWYWRLLPPFGNQLRTLTTAGFIERLAQTEEGKALYQEAHRKGQAHLDRAITEIASKYEAFGDSASQVFQRRSRGITCIIGLCLAFSLNLDVIHLFTTVLTDQNIRAELIQQGNQAAVKAEQALAALEESQNSTNDANNVNVIRENLQEILSSESTIASFGIPIGWETAPWRQESWELTCKACSAIKWFISVFLGGLLVGLGSPFWFDTFSRLSALVRQVRNPQTPVQQAKEVTTNKEAAKIAPLNLTAVFEKSAIAALTAHLSGRPLLDTDGSISREAMP